MKFVIRSMMGAAAVAVLSAGIGSAEAKVFKLFGAAEEPLPPGVVAAPVVAGPEHPAVCCPNPCIKYRNAILDCKVRCCDPCKPPVQMVLQVMNPCTCCPVEVPVCLPSCCCDVPTVECRKALFGSHVVSHEWCCGVEVNVRFQRDGDILVTYRGT
jgi:hypothetical protein